MPGSAGLRQQSVALFLAAQAGLVNGQSGSHRRRQGYLLQIDPPGCRRFRTLQIRQQVREVFLQRLGVKANLAYGALDNAVSSGALADLSCDGVADSGSVMRSHCAVPGLVHQPPGSPDPAPLTTYTPG